MTSQNQRILMQVVRIKFFNRKYQTAKKYKLKMQIQVQETMKLFNLLKKWQKINKKKVLMANLLDLNHNHFKQKEGNSGKMKVRPHIQDKLMQKILGQANMTMKRKKIH